MPAYYESGKNGEYGEEYGLKSWMEEAECLAFWNQALEVSQALSAKYISDKAQRTKSNKGLISHLIGKFFKFLDKH